MASITLSANALVDLQGAAQLQGIAGEAIAQGKLVYRDPITRKFFLAKADAAGTKICVGVARNGAALGAPLDVAPSGLVSGLGAVLTAGLYYVLSAATAGAIAPVADLVSTNADVLVGLALTTSTLQLLIKDWEYTLP